MASKANTLSWRDTLKFLCSCKKVTRDKSKRDSFSSRFVDARVFMPEHQEISRSIMISPETYELPYEIVSIRTKDNFLLMAYLIVHIEQNYNIIPTIIVYHGNGGNIGDCLPIAERFFIETVCNVLLVEYRGFGFSQGIPSEEGVYLDAQAAVDFVVQRPDLDSYKIVLYGISLGKTTGMARGAVAIDLATKLEYRDYIAAVIVENTFASLEQIVNRILPKLFKPLLNFLRVSEKFPSLRKISKVTAPTLFLSGLKDKFILPEHMSKLFAECGAQKKKLVCFPNGEHLTTWNDPDYAEQIAEFLQETLGYIPLIILKPKSSRQKSKNKAERSSSASNNSAPRVNSKQLLSLREALENLPGPKNSPKITTKVVE